MEQLCASRPMGTRPGCGAGAFFRWPRCQALPVRSRELGMNRCPACAVGIPEATESWNRPVARQTMPHLPPETALTFLEPITDVLARAARRAEYAG